MISALLACCAQTSVLFSDGFEGGNLDFWGDKRGTPEIVTDDPFEGKRCVKFTAGVGQGAGAHIVRWFMPGYDQIAVRWAVKFAPDFDQGNHMHLCALAGNRTDNKYSAFG